MTDDIKFRPGDTVGVKQTSAALTGLGPNGRYIVQHVDDFGRIQLRGRWLSYRPSHFYLVSRYEPKQTYCLLDGAGDWWAMFETELGPEWRLVAGPNFEAERADVVTGDVDEGADILEDYYRIDAHETRYCLLDGEGDWWVSRDGEGFVLAREVEEYGDEAYEDPPEAIEAIHREYGVDNTGRTTLYAKPGQIYYAPLGDPEPIGHMSEEPLADWERELLERPELRVEAGEDDQRVQAWYKIATHPIFLECYEEERPLIEAMTAKLDRIHEEGYTVRYTVKDFEPSEPQPGDYGYTAPTVKELHEQLTGDVIEPVPGSYGSALHQIAKAEQELVEVVEPIAERWAAVWTEVMKVAIKAAAEGEEAA